jgi:cullin-associated NEDD8-dissociated protein 1
LNSAAHNKPRMIKECLPELLPALYNETNVKMELVREVEMGPFKHIVDDGLDLRKAAFEWFVIFGIFLLLGFGNFGQNQ